MGFVARCALELDDAGEIRLAKITRIIEECPYGIHDISSVGLDTATQMPRFNMPFELGLYLGCKFFGSPTQKEKRCLILDREQYRYRVSISDIAGQDIHAHKGEPAQAIKDVRDWLVGVSKAKGVPGGAEISSRYLQFKQDLPGICKELKRAREELTFIDFSEMVAIWLESAQ
jgi:hypothetical protein